MGLKWNIYTNTYIKYKDIIFSKKIYSIIKNYLSWENIQTNSTFK